VCRLGLIHCQATGRTAAYHVGTRRRDSFLFYESSGICFCVIMNAGAGEGDCGKTSAASHTFYERKLLNCLLHEEYDPAVRPATSPDAPVEVIVDSILATIVDLVGSFGILCLSAFRARL